MDFKLTPTDQELSPSEQYEEWVRQFGDEGAFVRLVVTGFMVNNHVISFSAEVIDGKKPCINFKTLREEGLVLLGPKQVMKWSKP